MIWGLVLATAVVLGIFLAAFDIKSRPKPVQETLPHEPREKPGRIYFLTNGGNPERIQVVKSRGELATPLKVVKELIAGQPNAVLAQVYRELQHAHISGTWYDGDSVRMWLDSKKGAA
jgi:hypothetical protein